jgi:phycobilisome rod-core linker protein
MMASNRQCKLESQLKSCQITVRDFIEELASSDTFRRLNFEPNSNYRLVHMCVGVVIS